MAMQLDERCAVVALTHDPKLDDLALMEALKSPAFYVGALGSRANNAKRRERLLEFDRHDEEIARLHGPDRPLHRQPHAAGDRDLDPRRDHRGQERRRSARHRDRRRGQGAYRRVRRLRRVLMRNPIPMTADPARAARKAALDALLLDTARRQRAQLNGLDAYFVWDRMFACISGGGVGVRVPVATATELQFRAATSCRSRPPGSAARASGSRSTGPNPADYAQDRALFDASIEFVRGGRARKSPLPELGP